MNPTNSGTIHMNGGKGKCETVMYGGIFCKRYTGEFAVDELNTKAELGLWFTGGLSFLYVEQGSGETPEAAIQNAIDRTRQKIASMQQGVERMQTAMN